MNGWHVLPASLALSFWGFHHLLRPPSRLTAWVGDLRMHLVALEAGAEMPVRQRGGS